MTVTPDTARLTAETHPPLTTTTMTNALTPEQQIHAHAHAVLNVMNCPSCDIDGCTAALVPYLALVDGRVVVPDADGRPRMVDSLLGDGIPVDYPIAWLVREKQVTDAGLRWSPWKG